MDNRQATLELGTKPIGQLLRQYAMPAIVAMTASSLYNMVDSIFIGQGVGALAISGLAITFPFMNLTAAFGAAIGVGASTYMSVKLGQKDYKTADKILGNNVTLNLIIGLSLTVVCLLFLDPLLYFFGASKNTISYARDYMEVILAGNVFSHMYFGMNAMLRSASKPRQAMYATIFTVIANAIMDPVFIYSWGLNLGIRGAAYATILSQIMALCYQMKIFTDKKQMLHLKKGIYGLEKDLVKNILAIGMSPFLMNVCACVVVIFVNHQFVHFGGDLAVGAYGIANKVAMIFVMIVMGFNQGMQPIAGYNYGSQQFDRLVHVLRLTILCATIVTTVGWIAAVVFPYLCVRPFTSDSTLLKMSEYGLRVTMLMMPFDGFQMVTANFFQCIGKVKVSIFMSLSRQLLFLIPLLAVLPEFFGLSGVWFAIPCSDLTAAVVAAFILYHYNRKLKKISSNAA